jgi:hypothetical protein
MITFLVSIALFHFYNFIINKDDISSKIGNYKDKFLNFEENKLNIGKNLSELIKKVNDKIATIEDIDKHHKLTNLQASVKNECKKFFDEISQKIKVINLELRNLLKTTPPKEDFIDLMGSWAKVLF